MPKKYPDNKPSEKDTGYGRPFNDMKVNPPKEVKVEIRDVREYGNDPTGK